MFKKIIPMTISTMRMTGLLIVLALIFLTSGNTMAENRRTITDMTGRQVTISGEVNRIIPTFKPVTLCILSLGLQNKIVGIDSHSKRDQLTRAVFPEVEKLKGVGSKSTGLNFETIVSLKPDLVVLYAQKDGRVLADRLAVMGIPAVIILPESFDSVKKSLEIIARAAGNLEKAKQIEAVMDTMLDQVAARIKTIPMAERKTGYFASPRGLFSTATGNMLQDEIMGRAGIINVAHDLNGYFQDISPEQFIAWNPDIVILSRNLGRQTLKRLNNPALSQVRAIRTKAIYRFPCNLAPWDFPSPLSVLGTLWVAKTIYPGLFADTDMNEQSNRFHQALFGKSFQEMGGTFNDIVYEEPSH
ncbi:MAG: ABC transporter substrate-binding protein [Desulfobacteraceae bacterium]|jgi:iron complex transport system substrate-binding protein|nr:ABC transporter substrate-binding protein [Desulfobacteraceae bacterium]